MAVFYSPSIIIDGLILCLDAGNIKSYPGSGTTWSDISSQGKNGTLTGPTYSNGAIVFDGVDDYISSVSNLTLGNNFSISLWVKHNISTPVQERYISLGSDRIVIQENENSDLNLYVTDGTDQQLWNCGANFNGELGNNNNTLQLTPVTTILGGTNWKSLDGGANSTTVIKTDGTLWNWGINSFGQLGINAITNRSTPVTTILGGTNWKLVSCGENYTFAIKTDGTLWTWGYNNKAQLGVNDGATRSIPVTTILGGTDWKSVSSGGYSVLTIKTDGTLWTWGDNSFGQLGINDSIDRSTPVTTILGGTNWKSVSSGKNHVTAIKTDGTLWNWGWNQNGVLGINRSGGGLYISTPVTTILGGNNWKQVSAGQNSTAAIKTDGTLWTWGGGDSGRLGIDGSFNMDKSTPVTTILGGTNWKSVDNGGYSMVAIKTDGTLWSWGSNNVGQLGINDNTYSPRSTPVTTILGGTNWKSAFAWKGNHLSAIKTNATFINDVSTNASILNSTYYNIVATSNGTTLTLYQNGTSVATETLNGSLSSTDVSYTISSVLESFAGSLASVMVYNKALTSSEVQQNYNALKSRFVI